MVAAGPRPCETDLDGDVEITADEMSEGMVLAQDVLSGTGILLLRAGTRLDAETFQAMRRSLTLDAGGAGIFVLMEKSTAMDEEINQ